MYLNSVNWFINLKSSYNQRYSNTYLKASNILYHLTIMLDQV